MIEKCGVKEKCAGDYKTAANTPKHVSGDKIKIVTTIKKAEYINSVLTFQAVSKYGKAQMKKDENSMKELIVIFN